MNNNKELVDQVAAAVKQILENNSEFSNVARPKATKASTATQGAWNINEKPKASASTEGAWDATDSPGGVSSNAKKVWTVKDIESSVRKAVAESAAFHNPTHPYPAKGSASNTQQINDPIPSGKISASTQTAWKDEKAQAPGKVSASTVAQILTNVYKLDDIIK